MNSLACKSTSALSLRAASHSRQARRVFSEWHQWHKTFKQARRSARAVKAVKCTAEQSAVKAFPKKAVHAATLAFAALATHAPEAHAAAMEVMQLAHSEEEFGPTPFWVYVILAIPAPTVVFLMLSGAFGETGTHYTDGSNSPAGK